MNCDRIWSGEYVTVIARSNVLSSESLTRIDVVNVPDAVMTPIRPPVVDGEKFVGCGCPSCTRNPGISAAPGVYEKWYGGRPPLTPVN